MLIPVGVIWGLWFLLFLEHLCNLASVHDVAIKFQALFCRIALMFPLSATLTYIAAAFPWCSAWVNFITSILESYCLIAFLALLSGLAHICFSKTAFREGIIQSYWTRKPFLFCGSSFSSGEYAYYVYKVCVMQVLLFKPLSTLIVAIATTITHGYLSTALRIFMRILGTVSLVISVLAILRLYKYLADAPGHPLQGHNVLAKFVVVKILFMFIVLDNLIIDPLVQNKIIPVDGWICPPDAYAQELGQEFCFLRLICVIFICQIVFIILPAVYSYRHHGLHKLNRKRGANIRHFLFYTFFGVLELRSFLDGDVVNIDLKDPASEAERDNLLAETVMDKESLRRE